MNVLTTRLSPLYLEISKEDYLVVQRLVFNTEIATMQLFTPAKLFHSLVNGGNGYRFYSPQDDEGIELMLHDSISI